MVRAPDDLHTQTLHKLGLAIASGELPAGYTITIEELEERYGVSRSVIREILRALAAIGMVASRKRVGITVLPMNEWNVYDLQVIRWRLASPGRITQLRALTELRAAIEPEAAKLASVRAPLGRSSDLVGLSGRMWAAGRGGDTELFLRLDIEFHSLVLEMSGNEMFSRLQSLVSEVLAGRTHYGMMPEHPHDEALQLHVDVANGIQSGNADAAGAAMVRIMQRTLTEMSAIWQQGSGAESPAVPPAHAVPQQVVPA